MICREVMTGDPACCIPGDPVSVAAQIMKRENVGAVPVVTSEQDMRLVGIVTDRDLAIQVVSEGRDPHATRVDDVMSPQPVTCNEADDVSAAVRKMAAHQIRRLPVVDESGRLVGIVAQADVARYAENEEVGEMIEEISQPFGSEGWLNGKSAWGPAMTSAFRTVACVGAGAGLMYLLERRLHNHRVPEYPG